MSVPAPVTFTRSMGLGSSQPEVPPEYLGTITAFGFPSVMKRLHRSMVACVNRIPKDPVDGQTPLRDEFLKCIGMGMDDQEIVDELSRKIGMSTAREDLLQRRISAMTPVDFIVDKSLATPDQESVSRVRNELLREDRERFAKVLPTPGKSQTNEWDFMKDVDPSNSF